MAVFQTRGRSFMDYLKSVNGSSTDNDELQLNYPVDTITYSGEIDTQHISICAAGTLGSDEGKDGLKQLLETSAPSIQIIGVGVTEAGLACATNPCMVDLTRVLFLLYKNGDSRCKICIVNTDNVPMNGDVIRGHVLQNAHLFSEDEIIEQQNSISFVQFLETNVAFLNSMVDRITSARKGSNGMVPSCEPLPEKALVICDPGSDLPDWMKDIDLQKRFGVRLSFLDLLSSC